MALIELENGSLIDVAELNNNFEYLDDKIGTSVEDIAAYETSINSAIASINGSIANGSLVPAGSIFYFAGSSVPTGYLLCDGLPRNKNTYPTLFSVIQYTYGGSGDNFNLPNLIGAYPEGSATVDGQVHNAEYQDDWLTTSGGDHNHTYQQPLAGGGSVNCGGAGSHSHSYRDSYIKSVKHVNLLPCIKT